MSVRSITLDELPGLSGQELGRSPWMRIDQADIERFARLNGDDQWIHLDIERAQKERGGTIAQAFLVMSMMSAMTREIVSYEGISHGFNYGFDRLRFTGPTPAGSRVRLIETLVSVETRGDGLLLRRHCLVEVEGQSRPALTGDWLILVFPSA